MSAFERLPQAIRWLRIRRHLTQVELARAAGVSRSWLSSFERGESRPSLTTLDALLTALRADLETLSAAIESLASRGGDVSRRRYRRPKVFPSSTEGIEVSVHGFQRFLELLAGHLAGAPAGRESRECH